MRMRSKQRNDRFIPADPAKHSPSEANLKRRGFLLTLGIGGAGAAAVAARALTGTAVAIDATPAADAAGKGYQLTEHVRRYYRTTKV